MTGALNVHGKYEQVPLLRNTTENKVLIDLNFCFFLHYRIYAFYCKKSTHNRKTQYTRILIILVFAFFNDSIRPLIPVVFNKSPTEYALNRSSSLNSITV